MYLSDQETAVDLLYYETIAGTISKLIRESAGKPITIGVHGDWGAGKSSVLKMVEATFAGDKNVLCLWFNGWTFEGFEDAKTVIVEELVESLKRARPISRKILDASKRVLARLDWLKVARKAGGIAFNLAAGLPLPSQFASIASAVTGVSGGATTEGDDFGISEAIGAELSNQLASAEVNVPSQIHAFRKDFANLLEAAGVARLVVLVDDLDRCLPETAIATLEAIRLFLFAENAAFVIGADEAMIEYSVRRHFPDLPMTSGPSGYARNYLEKLIQVPFRIPALGQAETRLYVSLLLAQPPHPDSDPAFAELLSQAKRLLKTPWITSDFDMGAVNKVAGGASLMGIEDALRLSTQISGILGEGTRGNPRQIKRFLNALYLRLAIAEARQFRDQIDRAVLAKLMLAERFAPEFYDSLARLTAAAADGKPGELSDLERASVKGVNAKQGKQNIKGKGDALPTVVDEWLRLEWIKMWAGTGPSLLDTDLRPYVFVSRDRRAAFDLTAAPSHLDSIVERLKGDGLVARSAEGQVKALGAIDAERVFEALAGFVSAREEMKLKPPGVDGMTVLVSAHPKLQTRLVGFLSGLDALKIGAWAVTGWGSSITESDARAQLAGLIQTWETAGNPTLKAAIDATKSLGGLK
jgi:predicted KAP-like P-loop ATPase